MTLPTSKELKRLAATCRKAGIKHFKSGDFEFTLSDSLPEPRRRANASEYQAPDAAFQGEELTQDQLLNWSILPIPQQDSDGPSEN